MESRVTCYDCGRTAEFPRKRCDCGEPLWFDVEPAARTWPETGERSLWRYADWLPVATPAGVGGAAGGTPLYRVAALDDYAGCRVWVKAETTNVTGSFKDRGSAVGAVGAREAGYDRLGTVSHGNMGISTAAHAAAAGLGCVALVPADISAGRLAHLAGFDPTIVRVAGEYGRLYYDTLDLGPELGVSFVNSDTPLRVAGQKTVAYELLEAFAPDVPDALVLPTSSGGHASAIWKALRELSAWGLVDDLPRIHLVQAAACDPIAAAFREGRDAVTPVERGDTIAYSIGNPDPPSGTRALAAVRDTGGVACAVDDAAMREARARLATGAGLSVEPSSAAALAGLRTLAADGHVDADDEVAVIATGTGFREEPAASVEPPTVARDALADRLPALLG